MPGETIAPWCLTAVCPRFIISPVTTKDIVAIMNDTFEDDALLVAWLGDLDTPCAYWPTSDRADFEAALCEWIRRDTDTWTECDSDGDADGDGEEDDRVERYMSEIMIELPEVSDGQIEDLRAEALMAGDLDMVADCDAALDDDDAARDRCRDAILAARASR